MSVVAFSATAIPGVLRVHPRAMPDSRGAFVKTFFEADFAEAGLATCYVEEFHTTSRSGVVRGMHFQTPPHAQDKVVFCVSGGVFDVVLDLRVGSPAFGFALSFELTGPDGHGLYIPAGCAHGFAALTDKATMSYKVTVEYAPDYDAGVLWSSVPGIVWPTSNPQLSERDAGFPDYLAFESPFVFAEGDRS